MIPIYEETGTRAAIEAEEKEIAKIEDSDQSDVEIAPEVVSTPAGRKTTLHLIDRAIERLIRAGGRRSEAEAAHLLEGIAVVVYDPDTATISSDVPKTGSGLRWKEFIDELVTAYRARFED